MPQADQEERSIRGETNPHGELDSSKKATFRRDRRLWGAGAVLCIIPMAASLSCLAVSPPIGSLTHSVPVRVLVATGLASAILIVCSWRCRVWKRAISSGSEARRAFTTADSMSMAALGLIALVPRLLAARHSLWYDELWTLGFMRSGPVYALTHQGGYNNHLLNSLLGSLIYSFWKRFTGHPAGFHSDWYGLVRIPSLLFGTAAVLLLYAALRQQLGRSVAFTAALLLALSPSAIDLSVQTRGYSSLIFFIIAQTWAIAVAMRTRRAWAWLLWLVCIVVGTLAHLYLIFPVLMDFILIGVLLARQVATALGKPGLWRRLRSSRELLEQSACVAAAWILLTFACYAGVLDVVRQQLHHEAGTVPMARAHEVIVPMLESWGGVPGGMMRPLWLLLCGCLALVGLITLLLRRFAVGFYLLLILMLPPLLVEIAKPHFVYIRFFTFALPAFLTLLACGIQTAATSSRAAQREAGFRTIQTLLLCLLIGLTLSGIWQVLQLPKQDYRGAAAWANRYRRPAEGIASVGPGGEYLKSYGLAAFYPRSIPALERFLREKGEVMVVDTDLMVNAHRPARPYTNYLREHAGAPIRTFAGRYPGWTARWLDGDSDLKIYRLHASRLHVRDLLKKTGTPQSE